MVHPIRIFFVLLCSLTIFKGNAQNDTSFNPQVVYQSGNVIITRLTPNTWEHTSFKPTDQWGKVPCNGLVVKGNDEVIIFDTPTNDTASEELIQWLKATLHVKIKALIVTHFHDDCLGGLAAFHHHQISSYASFNTIALAKESDYEVPQHGFNDSLLLHVANEKVMATYFGEGHTRDNIVGYFPSEAVLFGGCLVKELGAGKGYVADANVSSWFNTVKKVKAAYPMVKIVVPGHGQYGNEALLDYTIRLFEVE